jgi:Coenzyme PQQ synthesis protein D (PqqD)
MNPLAKFVHSPRAMFRAVGEETVLLDLESGTYFGLNPVGARIWQIMGEGKTFAEISDVILDEYDVTRERIEADLVALADQLAEQKLISVNDD